MDPVPGANPAAPARIGLMTAVAILVTNMIGTGVFTSLGFQLAGIESPSAVLLLWLLGGVMALCGAAVYGELGVMFPRSGGEYNYLSRTYHPLPGFLAGWLSATVGFAAPVALSAKAFGAYLAKVLPQVEPAAAACACIVVVAAVHAAGVREGSLFQNLVTAIEIVLILFLILAGFFLASPQPVPWGPDRRTLQEVLSAPFAVSLVYVSYAYSGWNAATYVAGEIRNARRNLPVALLAGTALVTVLYVLLNFTFLRTAPAAEMQGALEVAHISAGHVFGQAGARIMSLVLCVALLGSVSGMTLAGPRIPFVMAEDYPVFGVLLRRNRRGSPFVAVALQSAIALVLVLSGTFEAILTYIGFALSLCTCLTVAGIFLVRARGTGDPGAYRCWGYPATPVLFLALNLWMLVFILQQRPAASALGVLTISTGIPLYFWLRRRAPAPSRPARPV
jgi:APA family basic amino acid/polyamine antiporter